MMELTFCGGDPWLAPRNDFFIQGVVRELPCLGRPVISGFSIEKMMNGNHIDFNGIMVELTLCGRDPSLAPKNGFFIQGVVRELPCLEQPVISRFSINFSVSIGFSGE
jgi:hypothetical protein